MEGQGSGVGGPLRGGCSCSVCGSGSVDWLGCSARVSSRPCLSLVRGCHWFSVSALASGLACCFKQMSRPRFAVPTGSTQSCQECVLLPLTVLGQGSTLGSEHAGRKGLSLERWAPLTAQAGAAGHAAAELCSQEPRRGLWAALGMQAVLGKELQELLGPESGEEGHLL